MTVENEIDMCPECKSRNIDVFWNDYVDCRDCDFKCNVKTTAELRMSQKHGTEIKIEDKNED